MTIYVKGDNLKAHVYWHSQRGQFHIAAYKQVAAHIQDCLFIHAYNTEKGLAQGIKKHLKGWKVMQDFGHILFKGKKFRITEWVKAPRGFMGYVTFLAPKGWGADIPSPRRKKLMVYNRRGDKMGIGTYLKPEGD